MPRPVRKSPAMSSELIPSTSAWLAPEAPAQLRLAEGSDGWCVAYWLQARASGSVHTRRAYQREAARWLAFLAASAGREPPAQDLLRSATYDNAASYIAWIERTEPLPDLPQWAATYYGISPARPKGTQKVLQTAVVILHGMYDELASAMVGSPPRPAVPMNPFKPYRRRFKTKVASRGDDVDAPGVAKALSDEAWALLWEVACETPPVAKRPHHLRLAARRRLALAMLRATWERRAAVAGLTWGDLQRSRDGTWKVRRNRKGKGLVWDPVPDALIGEIARFRASCGLPLMPAEAESERSVYWVGGSVGASGPISDDTLYRDIKILFDAAATRAKARENAALVEELVRAGRGPHAIRHTMATQFMAAGGEARRAQEILGHSSIAVTTRVYDSRTEREKAEALEDQWERSAAAAAAE